jgi:hypothetical protein
MPLLMWCLRPRAFSSQILGELLIDRELTSQGTKDTLGHVQSPCRIRS